LHVLEATDVAEQARRAGFIERSDMQPVVFMAPGGESLPPGRNWRRRRLDGSSW
jgi:hypothetical protein